MKEGKMQVTIGPWRIALERTQPTLPELIRMYDVGATHWHRAIERLGYLQAYTALFQQIQAERVFGPVPTNARVLDAGIGTGALSLALMQLAWFNFHLDGVDLSLAMLRQAHRLLNQMGLQYTLTQQDVCTLQFPSATFDLVMSAHVLEHVSDPPAALREMVRVLRPDAPLLLLVSQPGILTTFIQLRWRYVAHTANQIKQWINEAGVRDVHIYPLQGVLPSRTSLAYLGFKAE